MTPEFSEEIKYIELNPWWYVPASIIREVKGKSGYETVRTGNITGIRQPPGPRNALGRLKVVFPNRHNVYLHDTPSRYLFKKDYRAYSHGCIRLQRPVDLALWLLQDDQEWTEKRIQKEIRRGVTKRVPVEYPSMVHITYLTAWVDDEGELHFRNDVYRRDNAVLSRLKSVNGTRTASGGMQVAVHSGVCTPLTAGVVQRVSGDTYHQ